MRIELPLAPHLKAEILTTNPWFHQFGDCSPKEIGDILAKFWSSITSPALMALSKRFLPVEKAYLVKGIAFDDRPDLVDEDEPDNKDVNEDLTWLMLNTIDGTCVSPKTGFPSSHLYCLGAPADVAFQLLTNTPSSSLVEFYSYFHWLREAPYPEAGHFISPEKWIQVNSDPFLNSYKGIESWRDAVIIFHASTGDLILLRSDESTAWAQLETQKVLPLAQSFEEFASHYARYKSYDWPFNSWGV